MLRLLYRFLYWFADRCGSEADSDIQYGFYRKFRKPSDIPASELPGEIKRLAEAISNAT